MPCTACIRWLIPSYSMPLRLGCLPGSSIQMRPSNKWHWLTAQRWIGSAGTIASLLCVRSYEFGIGFRMLTSYSLQWLLLDNSLVFLGLHFIVGKRRLFSNSFYHDVDSNMILKVYANSLLATSVRPLHRKWNSRPSNLDWTQDTISVEPIRRRSTWCNIISHI